MREHRQLIVATAINVIGIIIALVFTRTYPRGLNIGFIFFVILIIQAILAAFLWFCTLNHLSLFFVRLSIFIMITVNCIMIFVVLIAMDTFIASLITPFFTIIMLLGSSVMYLQRSMKLG